MPQSVKRNSKLKRRVKEFETEQNCVLRRDNKLKEVEEDLSRFSIDLVVESPQINRNRK